MLGKRVSLDYDGTIYKGVVTEDARTQYTETDENYNKIKVKFDDAQYGEEYVPIDSVMVDNENQVTFFCSFLFKNFVRGQVFRSFLKLHFLKYFKKI